MAANKSHNKYARVRVRLCLRVRDLSDWLQKRTTGRSKVWGTAVFYIFTNIQYVQILFERKWVGLFERLSQCSFCCRNFSHRNVPPLYFPQRKCLSFQWEMIKKNTFCPWEKLQSCWPQTYIYNYIYTNIYIDKYIIYDVCYMYVKLYFSYLQLLQ